MKKEKKHLEKNIENGLKTGMNITFIVLFAILVLIILLVAFLPKIIPESLLKQENTSHIYNGFKIEQKGNFWVTDIQRLGTNTVYSVEFRNDPKSVDTIKTIVKNNASINNIYRYQKVYITFNPDDKNMSYIVLSASELSRNIAQVMNIGVLAGCSKDINDSACKDRKIINCDSVKANEYVIYLNEDEETSIILDKNCIQINGEGDEMLKATEKYLYNVYGII